MSDTYSSATIFSVASKADLGLTDIYLNEDQYRHVMLGHRDLKNVVVFGIQEAVENPTHVYLSKVAGGRFVFRSDNVQTRGGKVMAVVVERDQARGKVVTATPQANAQGDLIWESSGSLYSNYDRDADLMYISKGAARDAYAVEIGEDRLWLRVAEEDESPVGVTIFDLRGYWGGRISDLVERVAALLAVMPGEVDLRVQAALRM